MCSSCKLFPCIYVGFRRQAVLPLLGRPSSPSRVYALCRQVVQLGSSDPMCPRLATTQCPQAVSVTKCIRNVILVGQGAVNSTLVTRVRAWSSLYCRSAFVTESIVGKEGLSSKGNNNVNRLGISTCLSSAIGSWMRQSRRCFWCTD